MGFLPQPVRLSDVPGGGVWNVMKNVKMDQNALERQGIENEFLRPNAEQNLLAQKLKNQFTPLDMAIKAQNALVYNNRFGNIGMYLRSIGEMPANQRSAYLAQPENYNFYNNMLEQFKYGMKNPQSQGSILSPEYVASFGIGTQNQNQMSQPNQQDQMELSPPAAQNALRGMGMPQELPGGMNQGISVPPVAPGSPQPPTDLTISPEQAKKLSMSNMPRMNSDNENRMLYNQLLVNQKATPAPMNKRIANVIAMEDWIVSNKDHMVKAIENSARYTGAEGKFKYWYDTATNQNSEARQDYVWLTNTFLPDLASQNKRIEDLSGTDQQRQELHGIVGAMNNWQLRPDDALIAFNKQIRTLREIGDSTIKAGEPLHKGVYKKLYNIKPIEELYIPEDVIKRFQKGKTSETKQPSGNSGQLKAPEGKILVEFNGKKGYLPADKWSKELEAKGYRRLS